MSPQRVSCCELEEINRVMLRLVPQLSLVWFGNDGRPTGMVLFWISRRVADIPGQGDGCQDRRLMVCVPRQCLKKGSSWVGCWKQESTAGLQYAVHQAVGVSGEKLRTLSLSDCGVIRHGSKP